MTLAWQVVSVQSAAVQNSLAAYAPLLESYSLSSDCSFAAVRINLVAWLSALMPWIILSLQQARWVILAVFLPMSPVLAAHAEVVELRAALVEKSGGIGVEYFSDDKLVGRSTPAVELRLLVAAPRNPQTSRSNGARPGRGGY